MSGNKRNPWWEKGTTKKGKKASTSNVTWKDELVQCNYQGKSHPHVRWTRSQGLLYPHPGETSNFYTK